jgi:hypothetical protein
MTPLEQDLRTALRDMAQQSRATPLLIPVLRRHEVVLRRRRLTVALAAAVTLVLVAAGVTALHGRGGPENLPMQRPPKVLRTSLEATAQPGRSRLALTLAGSGVSCVPLACDTDAMAEGSPTYVLPLSADRAVRLRPRQTVGSVNLQRLSSDGRFLLQLGAGVSAGALGLAVIDLRSGRERLLPNLTWTFAELSPDDATVAVRDNQMLTVVDVATGHTRAVRRLSRRQGPGAVAGAQLGWSPDGRLIAVKSITDTLVVDLRGHLEVRLRTASPVNGSQSWSPDGGSLLLYDTARSVYRVADVRDGGSTDLATPAGVIRALGWAGERIVWLAGSPGSQRLVTTDRTGHDEAPWTRLDVGSRAVYSVTWSRALSG